MKKLAYIMAVTILSAACKEHQKKETPEMEETAMESETKSPEVTITPIEHATAVLKWGDHTLYIDPVGNMEAFKGQKKPDLILITDIHGDHFSLETLDSLDTGMAKIIVPQAVADKMSEKYKSQLEILANGDSIAYSDITIKAVPMYNLREEALNFHTKGRGNGYVLTLGNERVYFSGDTEDIPEMRDLKNIDKAFICMNLPYTMTEESAASAVLEFKPKQVYPYHYRGNPNVSDVAKFKKLVNEGNPDIEVIQLDWYPKDDF